MSYTIKIFILVLLLQTFCQRSDAQDREADLYVSRHDIRISYSDGSTLSMSTFMGLGFSDLLTGTVRTGQQSSGLYSVGYRYAVNRRFKAGADIGFAKQTSTVVTVADGLPAVREREMNLLVLPTAELIYFKRKVFTLYGSASAGLVFNRHYETRMPLDGMERVSKRSAFERHFAFQVNPMGLRIGSERIGGLLETGLGHRGFITVGICLNC